VENIVLHKIQLNEYTQKLSLPAPSYKYTKEGPSHNPRFRASVLVNGKMYDSKSEFLTSKEAMHDAARVALEDLNAKGTTSVPNSVVCVLFHILKSPVQCTICMLPNSHYLWYISVRLGSGRMSFSSMHKN
jgi:hypothetical protein